MTMLKLIWFSIRQLSAMGHWQAGAELVGGDELRARADRHRELHRQAGMAIRAKVYTGLAEIGETAVNARASAQR